MDFKTLIYSKNFGVELTHRLLHIADSKEWLEDLVDLTGEIHDDKEEEDENCHVGCSHVEDAENEKDEAEGNLHTLELGITDIVYNLRKEMGVKNTNPDDNIDILTLTIDEYVKFRVGKITVGGVELPKK